MKLLKKIILPFLALAVLFASVYAISCYGLYGKWPSVASIHEEWQRDLGRFRSAFSSSDQPVTDTKQRIAAMKPLVTDSNKLLVSLRKKLVDRQTQMTFYYRSNQKLDERYAQTLYHRTLVPTSVSDEGDYITYHVAKMSMTTSYFVYGHSYYYTLKYAATYRTTRQEEAQVTNKVKQIVIPLQGKTDLTKIRSINDYLMNHVTYDANDSDCYSAYGALLKGRAVCQGYTLAMYRLLKECGIDNRMITGKGVTRQGEEAHSWNIIKVGTLYYDHDVTWNDSAHDYAYYLCGSTSFDRSHLPDERFKTASFTQAYPIAATAYQG